MVTQQHWTYAVAIPSLFLAWDLSRVLPPFLSLSMLAVTLDCQLSRGGKIIFERLFSFPKILLEAEVSIPRLQFMLQMMQIHTDGAMK